MVLVSVIMSVYNEKVHWLDKAINSILHQTFDDFEFLIVCDNPHNDEALGIINNYARKDSRIRIIINKKNLGLASSLNNALKITKGFYVARMDADDISDLTRIEKQVQYLNNNIDVDILSANIELINEDDQLLRKGMEIIDNNKFISKSLDYINIMNHPTWIVKKSVYLALHGYRDLQAAQDYDFLLRARSKGFKFGILNEHLLKYRIRLNSISSEKALYRLKLERKLKKNHSMDEFNNIRIRTLEGFLFAISQKTLNKANQYRFRRKFLKSAFYMILSCMISPNQFRRSINIILFRMLYMKHRRRISEYSL